jgi:hypothetical protein
MKDIWNIVIVDGNKNTYHLNKMARIMINKIIMG